MTRRRKELGCNRPFVNKLACFMYIGLAATPFFLILCKNLLWHSWCIRSDSSWRPSLDRRSVWYQYKILTHWGQVTHICVSKLTAIGSDNGLSPCRCQAVIWTNAIILLIRILAANFSEILSYSHIFSFNKMRLKVSCAKCQQFCLGLDVLK